MDYRSRIIFSLFIGTAVHLVAPAALAIRDETPEDNVPWEDTRQNLNQTWGELSGRKLPADQKTESKPSESAKKETDPQTGLRQGDKIILNQDSDYQRKVWNEQRDRESLNIRMQAAQGSYHRQGVSVDISPDAPELTQPPRMVEEFTDKNGNVWERFRVDKQDVGKFLEENKNAIRADDLTPTIMVSISPPRLLNDTTEKEKNVMDEKAGKSTPPAIVKGEVTETKPLEEKKATDPAVVFFDAVKNAAVEKPKEEEKLSELPQVKKPMPEMPKGEGAGEGEVTFNNDIELGASSGGGSEDVLRLKSVGRRPASQGPSIEDSGRKIAAYVKAGNDFTDSSFDYVGFNRGFSGKTTKAASFFRVFIALLAIVIGFLLVRETNAFKAFGLKLFARVPRLAVWWGMVSRKSKNG